MAQSGVPGDDDRDDEPDSLGDHIRRERKKEREQRVRQKVQEAFSEAWEAEADGRYQAMTDHALYLFLALQEDHRDRYVAGRFYEPFEFKAGTDSEPDFANPGWHGLSKLKRYFDRTASEAGYATWGSRLKRPLTALEDMRRRSDVHHAGVYVWNQWADGHLAHYEVTNALRYMEAAATRWGILEKPGEETYTLGSDNWGDSWLQTTFEGRRRKGQALHVLIYARDNRTGTGKTTLAVGLAQEWEGDDWDAEELATNRPTEFRRLMHEAPEQSVIMADEIGQMYDSRRSMAEDNVEVSQDFQMVRYREVITLATVPGSSFIDKRLMQLFDVAIVATRRGHGRVYELKSDDETGKPYRNYKENIEWGPLDGDPAYEAIEEMKAERFEERFGDDPDDDHADLDPDDARREGRNETIRQLVESGMTQREVADALEMDQSTVSRICRED